MCEVKVYIVNFFPVIFTIKYESNMRNNKNIKVARRRIREEEDWTIIMLMTVLIMFFTKLKLLDFNI